MNRLALFAAACTFATASAAQSPGNIAGNWRADNGRAIIAIGPCSSASAALCGRISRFLVAEPEGGARDSNNPDRALRNRSLLGVQVFTDLTRDGNSWTGRGYSPEDGRHFNATLTTQGNRLSVRGCVAIFCRTRVMTRAN